MSDLHLHPTPRSADALKHPGAARLLLDELHRILLSPSFRTSKRSQRFLKYVVERSVEGRLEDLKERTIGVAVFDKSPSYDTGEDATVRVAANEVRKRLAQYHLDSPNPSGVRIELAPGSYIADFHLPPDSLPATPATSSPRRRWLWLLPALLLAAAASILILLPKPSSPFDDFWRPALTSERPVLVCMAHPVLFEVSNRLRDDYKSRGYNERPETNEPGPPLPLSLFPRDIVLTEQYVGGGDAHAASLFSGLLSRMNKPIDLRIGNDVSFSDLRSSPAILIGAYSNRWTMQSNTEYRFGFGPHSVVDRDPGGKEWKLTRITPDYRTPEDYAIVSRILQSYSGSVLITAAGTTNFGTHSAAEFLTNPAYLNAALASAPSGWQKRNLQIVLHCNVIGSVPGPPQVVATHFW